MVAVLLPGEPLETADTTSISESIFWIIFFGEAEIFVRVADAHVIYGSTDITNVIDYNESFFFTHRSGKALFFLNS